MHTPDLKSTLPNLLNFLRCTDFKEMLPSVNSGFVVKDEDNIDRTRTCVAEKTDEFEFHFSKKYTTMYRNLECGPGLSEILAVPEAFMNKQISSDSFKNFVVLRNSGQLIFYLKLL